MTPHRPDSVDDPVTSDGPAVIDRVSFLRSGAVGAVATGVALATQEVAAGLIGPLPSLMAGSAQWVIDMAPAGVVEWSIGTLEFWTKRALIIGVTSVLLLVGVATSLLPTWGRRSLFVAVAVIGAFATAHGSDTLGPSLMSALVAAAAGIGTDAALRRPSGVVHNESRRVFVGSIAAIGAVAVAAALGGRALVERGIRRLARRDDVVLPEPTVTVDPVTSANDFVIEGLEPIITPNDRFYTVDITALNPPEIDLNTWTLTVTGLVENELVITYEDLLAMDLVEQYATLACVSNKVGGRLVGNARWLGVPFTRILEMANPLPAAEQVAAFGADGFATGFPLAATYDRDTILAIGMNDEPLPYKHGFPARLVIPGYYGFVSAAKWIERIELATWDGHDSYWVKFGWAKQAPIETQSRIDAPRDRMTIDAGPRMIAGMAWAPFHTIVRVDVSIDDTDWVEAELSEALSAHSWRQWRLPWNATPGEHSIKVRATDGRGITQTAEERNPIPNGATGHHTIRVTVA